MRTQYQTLPHLCARRCGRSLRLFRCDLAAAPDSVTFECDGTSSMCADGTLTWSCSEQCTSPGGSCSMVLSGAGLRGTIPAALGDVRCAPWITKLCVPAATCLAVRALPLGPRLGRVFWQPPPPESGVERRRAGERRELPIAEGTVSLNPRVILLARHGHLCM
jgi:hypothetical protein